MHKSTFLKLGLPMTFLGISLQVSGQSGPIAFTSADMMLVQTQQEQTQPLARVLPEIEAKYKVSFLYRSYDVKGKRVPSNLLELPTLRAVLDAVEQTAGLDIEPTGSNTYTLAPRRREGKPSKAAAPAEAALEVRDSAGTTISVATPISVTGKVLDETGQPLPGAAVFVMGTKTGMATNLNGEFTLEVEPDAVLQVKYIGYVTQEVAVAGRTSITISLQPDVRTQSEVVVVGYGTKTKREVTSSIGSVSAKEVTATPVADAAQALQGRVAGVQVIQNSGAPGGTGGTSIRIRGISSVTGSNNPLIVLDGFPLPDQTSDNVLNAIPPGDIESIDVLKDAAAASIYGVRGSNGVVMITTKRGKAGKATITFDMYRGIQNPWRKLPMLNAHDYAVINSEARLASGLAPLDKLANPEAVEAAYGNGTDWQKQIFRYAAMTNANLTISGGTEASRYSLSGGYFQQDGIVRGTNFDRFSFRFNGDSKVSDKFRVGNSLTMSRTTEHGKNTYDAFNSLLLLAVASPPTVQVRNPDGSYAGGNGQTDGFNEPNPVYDIEVPKSTNIRFRAIASTYAEYEIIPGLNLRANIGLDFLMQSIRTWSPAIPSTGGRPLTITGLSDQTNYNPSYLAEYTASYKKALGDHNLNALLGYTVQESNYNGLGASRSGYTRLDLQVLNDAAVVPQNLSQIGNFNYYGTNRLLSYVARAGYDYKGRYLISASLRRDGSSNFGPGNKYAFFPSVSAGWNVSDEAFMQEVKPVSNLKLRVSYGQTGNQNVAAFAYLQQINTGIQYPLGDNSGASGANAAAAPTSTKNPDLRWEKNVQSNIGLDIGLIGNRVNLTVDLYRRLSQDLILNVNPTATSGTYEATPFNTGVLQNQGVDLTLNTVNTPASSPVKWNTTFIFSKFVNKVTDLGQGSPILNGFTRITGGGLRVDAGAPINYFYGYVADGIFQTPEEVKNHAVQTAGTNSANGTSPGDIRYKDLNGDGVINDKDRTNLGNSIPNFTYGFTNNVSWKGLELSVFFQGSSGNKVLNFTRWYTESGIANGNYSTAVLDRWTGPGTSNSMPRMIQADPNQNNRVSSRFVEDASYLRIKNIRLTYTLPAKWTKATSASAIRIYGSVQNALTWTKYTGFDPEVGGGVDYGFYPQARTWIGGVTFEF